MCVLASYNTKTKTKKKECGTVFRKRYGDGPFYMQYTGEKSVALID